MTGEGNTEREREGIMAMAEKEGATIIELEPRGDFPDATECIVVRPNGSFFYYYYHPERFKIEVDLGEWDGEEIAVEYDQFGHRITHNFPDQSTFAVCTEKTTNSILVISLALGRQFPMQVPINQIKKHGKKVAELVFTLDASNLTQD